MECWTNTVGGQLSRDIYISCGAHTIAWDRGATHCWNRQTELQELSAGVECGDDFLYGTCVQTIGQTADLEKVGGVPSVKNFVRSPSMVGGRLERFSDISTMVRNNISKHTSSEYHINLSTVKNQKNIRGTL